MKLISLITLSVLVLAATASTWAVLIAGSNGYGNYRHQSDIFHAYQILRKNGVPAEQIITMAYDDIANNRANPFPGKVINKPNGQDVYAGVTIDYKGADVSAANFLAVLTGDSTAAKGKKVLNSTKDDNVFVFYSDHGAVGLVAVVSTYLYADQLNTAFNTMYSKQMYKKMVFYLEACESGSMFSNRLAKNMSIFATTASNPSESSWAQYCYPQDMVNGTRINSCLGDEYSVTWMEDSDAYDLSKRTLDDQFTQILKSVKKSHPQKYGTLDWTTDPLSDFHGNAKKSQTNTKKRVHPLFKKFSSVGTLNSRLSTLSSLKAVYNANKTAENLAAYQTELKSMTYFDRVFTKLNLALNKNSRHLQMRVPQLPRDLSCLRSAVDSFETRCKKFTDYSLQYVRSLANLCYSEKFTTEKIDSLIKTVC